MNSSSLDEIRCIFKVACNIAHQMSPLLLVENLTPKSGHLRERERDQDKNNLEREFSCTSLKNLESFFIRIGTEKIYCNCTLPMKYGKH